MDKQKQELLKELVGRITTKEEFDELRNSFLKQGIEALLNAEMYGHLGHLKGEKPVNGNIRNGYSEKSLKTADGEHRISIPRDRHGTFDPVIVPKHKRMTDELESVIISLYAKGMSNADVMDFMDRTYGVKYSTSQISLITDHLLDDIRAWQNRPLDDQYAVIWIDAIHYKMRHEGKVASKACMLALGINMEGQQDLLSITIVDNESASEWMAILDSLKSRGVEDVLFICSDNLKGMDKAIEAIFPKTIRQICIVHQIRNSLKFVNYKDRKNVAADIKQIYRALNEDEALAALEDFRQKWGHKYKPAIKSWEDNWHNLAAFLAFPSEIRKLIYTTNIIESFNAGLRKYTKNKKSFPTDDAALKSIYLAAMAVQNKWQKRRSNWPIIYNQLYINFENRIKPAN